MNPRLSSAPLAPLLLALVLAAAPGRAAAQSAAEIRGAARQVQGQVEAKKAAGSYDSAAQKGAIEELGKLSLQFIAACDRAATAGTEKGERDGLLSAFQALNQPLEDAYEQSAGVLDRMAKKIMEEDGDLDALYESPEYRRGQGVGAQALYYLNWLRYYGGRLHEGARRKELLEQAQRGFSDFTGGDKGGELQAESLLGRGLCSLELGNLEQAAADLKAVADEPRVPAERRGKARLALLDGYVRNGRAAEAIRLSEQMLSDPDRGDAMLVRYLRARALLDAARKAPGAEANRYRQEAMGVLDQLRKAGGSWDERAAALLASAVDNPQQWANDANNPFARWELARMLVAKGDFKQAAPLLQDMLGSNDPALQKVRAEAQYYLALARFQAGQLEEAATLLDEAVKDEKASFAADAGYLRFKTREAMAARSPEAAAHPAYEKTVREFLAQFPQHKAACEARFRLGELLQAQRKFDDAVAAFGQVQGDPAFELRALFGTLQCRFERIQEGGAPREAVLREIDREIPLLERQLAEADKRKSGPVAIPLAPLRAKLTMMKAATVNLRPEADPRAVIALLEGFEKRFPEQVDLHPQAARMRLVASLPLGRFTEAEADARAFGAKLAESYGAAAVEELAVAYVREGARRNATEPQANQRAQQVALRLYEHLPGDGTGSAKSTLTLARLYENTGDKARAAALYKSALDSKSDSLTALRGLARLEEEAGHAPAALAWWEQITRSVRPGDAPWYEGQYHTARLNQAQGRTKEACAQLEQLKPAMPGLSDVDLRGKLDTLYKQACR